MQYVGVEFRTTPGQVYSYQWDGEKPLKHGDRVITPPNWRSETPGFADVVFLYNSREEVKFKGELATIMGVVDED